VSLDLQALFDLGQVTGNVDVLVAGAVTTLKLSALSMVFAAIVGLLLAVLRSSRLRVISVASRAWIELIRGTPLLVQMYILYYGLPSLGITLSPVARWGWASSRRRFASSTRKPCRWRCQVSSARRSIS